MTKNSRRLSDLGERGFLRRFVPALARGASASFLVPPGDDAAVLSGANRLVLTVDAVADGTHFRLSWADRLKKQFGLSLGRALGWKAMGGALSDLAAMGRTRRRWCLLSLAAPGGTPVAFLDDLHRGVMEAARWFDCVVAGGDTIRASEFVFSVAAGGELVSPRALTRNAAKPGHAICLAGSVGDAAVGLEILSGRGARTRDDAFFVKRFFDHRPLFDAGAALGASRSVGAVLDLSDSVAESVDLLCESSRVGAEVHVERIPVSPAYRRRRAIGPALLGGGEDYALLFTAPRSALPALKSKIRFSEIGRVRAAADGARFFLHGLRVNEPRRFAHFT